MGAKELRLLFKKSSHLDTVVIYKDCVSRIIDYLAQKVYILQRNVEV